MSVRIQLRRGTAAEWIAADTILAAAEPGVEIDTGRFKIGDGATSWNSLEYFSGGGSTDQVGLAGAVISGERALAWRDDGTLDHMSSTDTSRAFSYAGVSTGAAALGAPVSFRKVGIVTANFWAWEPGPIFVGLDGQLTHTAPATGVLLPIGWATAPTSIDLKPGIPFLRT